MPVTQKRITGGRRLLRGRYLRAPLVAYRYLGVSEADVFLASFPRSGSTWLRFMVGHLLLGRRPEFDSIRSVLPGVGHHRRAQGYLPNEGRLIKTHERREFPYSYWRSRLIYLVRDGRDVAVSYYYWLQRRLGYESSFAEFLPAFLQGKFDGYGPWQVHVESWLGDRESTGGLLLIRYEDLLDDPEAWLARVADFLGMKPSREQVRAAVEGQGVESMQQREQRSTRLQQMAARPDLPYVRQGKSGQWREHFGEREMALFLEQAGSTLRKLGYAGEDRD